ncbi:hypothetical protein CHI02_22730 [Niallia circulans]|nr:hypothetical protein CHI02_22730 [Niallia circulans]
MSGESAKASGESAKARRKSAKVSGESAKARRKSAKAEGESAKPHHPSKHSPPPKNYKIKELLSKEQLPYLIANHSTVFPRKSS